MTDSSDANLLRRHKAGILMRRAAIASVSVSLFLVAIKVVAYFASHSVAMLASLADSALDLFASSLNFFAIRQALTPADDEHRFGHGKAEPLAGLAQGAFITASALFLVIQAISRIIAPEPIDNSIPAMGVMFVSILCTIMLVVYQRRVVNRTGSLAIESDRSHYSSDLITNLGVILALVLTTWMGWPLADPLIAIAVAGVMLFTAWGVGRESLDQLMDRELPQQDLDRIRTVVRGHGAVRSLHDLKTRQAGLYTFIQLHLEMDPAMPLSEAHAISDEVERDLIAAFPGADVIIHQDPAGLEVVQPGQ